MKKTFQEYVQIALGFITGFGFYGLMYLVWAAVAYFFIGGNFFQAVGLILVGCFIGKNAQAIREKIGNIKIQ